MAIHDEKELAFAVHCPIIRFAPELLSCTECLDEGYKSIVDGISATDTRAPGGIKLAMLIVKTAKFLDADLDEKESPLKQRL